MVNMPNAITTHAGNIQIFNTLPKNKINYKIYVTAGSNRQIIA